MAYQGSSCGYSCSASSGGYSGLENAVASYSSSSASYSSGDISYMVSESASPQSRMFYDGNDGNRDIYKAAKYRIKQSLTQTYSHVTDDFLNLNRPKTVFVGDAAEIKEFVEEAFMLTTGKPFPDDVRIAVVSGEQLEKIHSKIGGNWDPGIQGFAINRKKFGLVSEIFVRKGELDKLMLTIGHELGHCLTKQLNSVRDEEAKAFAFSLAWMKTIKEHNIANLSTAIKLDRPAKNGVHNVALDFVLDLINKGRGALDIYFDLIKGFIEVNSGGRDI
ncbi:hypothetical protein KY331_05310 [Candidatus Woesearchaeota archaeon]|nr:hypothetical protein [Candidatus Woesearchaeota archaeon]